jgi:hypothetical protein
VRKNQIIVLKYDKALKLKEASVSSFSTARHTLRGDGQQTGAGEHLQCVAFGSGTLAADDVRDKQRKIMAGLFSP